MDERKSFESVRDRVSLLESLLNIRIPKSYREFLLEDGSAVINGLPLIGFPLSPTPDSVWGATELLRAARPDLEKHFITLRFMDSRALALDLHHNYEDDAPLVDISLTQQTPPRKVHESFRGYIFEGRRSARQIKGALRRIRNHLRHSKPYAHDAEGTPPPFRAHEWRVLRSCVHDRVVGLTAIRHSERLNGLEVDAFTTADHPDYKPGHALRALLVTLLSDAYRNGASMQIVFTRYDSTSRKRVAERLPYQIERFASEVGVKIDFVSAGIITHQEAVKLYMAILGMTGGVSGDALRIAQAHQASGRYTIQGLCFVISAGIWSVREASWILLNSQQPEGLLFGEAVPEERIQFMKAMHHGRSALAAEKLFQKLCFQEDDSIIPMVEVSASFWKFNSAIEVPISWSNKKLVLRPSENMLVMARPRPLYPGVQADLRTDLDYACSLSVPNSKGYLLYTSDAAGTDWWQEWCGEAEKTGKITILTMPFTVRELDDEITERLARARRLRK